MSTKLARYCEGIMEAAWLAAVILVPIFFNTYSARIFEPDKITLLRSLAILILAAWMVKLIEDGRIRWEKLPKKRSFWATIRSIPLVLPVLLLVLSYLVSTLFSVAPRTSLWGSYQRLQGFYTTLSYLIIFAALLGNLRRVKQVERIITVIILASLPVSLYGILQRLQVDPVPWSANVTVRVAANLGNSIFVAAYLIMAFPLTVARIVNAFDAILKAEQQLILHVIRGTIYVFIAAAQVITIYLSGSRGPFLGLLASSFFLLLLLSLRWRKQWLTYLVIAGAVAGSVFLLFLNVENGPLEPIRRSPYVGRLGRILDPTSNNALVRKYIWEGAAELVMPHAPLEFPDGRKDALNFLRPLIGYGPESMYVAFNPFYPPELGQVEKRNASPDRSHNETWDSLVFTGIFGFSLYIAIFIALFYYGLKWLGLITHHREVRLFFAFTAGGGLIGAVLMILWGGVEFFGVGLPFGLAIGIILYLAVIAVTGRYEAPRTQGDALRSLTLVALFAAVLAHFLEINFGIAIAATRLYFWVFSALIVLVGYILPLHGEYGLSTSELPSQAPLKDDIEGEKGASRVKRRKDRLMRSQKLKVRDWDGVDGGLIIGFILITLNYIYILNQTGRTSGLGIFWSALTSLPSQGNAVFFGVLMLMLTCWLFGAVIYTIEHGTFTENRTWFTSFITILGVAGGIGLLFGIAHSFRLAEIASVAPTNQDELIQKVNTIGGLLTHYYLWIFALVFLLGFLFVRNQLAQSAQPSRWGLLAAPVLMVMFVWATYNSNLRIVHADIAYKMADPFTSGDQWLVATVLYNHALDLAPNEDYYYLFLGRSYLEEAKQITDATAQESLVKKAEEDLQIAQKINPLNTDHTANLARLYSWWAAQTEDTALRLSRGQKASEYYRKAVTLSPNNSTLWGEWAVLLMDLLGEPEEARSKLEYALNLDPNYSFTQGLMGDYYVKLSRTRTDPAARVQDLETALEFFREAVRVAKPAEKITKINYIVMTGNVYVELAGINSETLDPEMLKKAAEAYSQALLEQPEPADLARIEEQIARIYLELGDRENALIHARNALQNSAVDRQDRINQLIQKIEALP